MRCTCPKCNSNIELDLASVPEAGSTVKCTECQAKFLLRRESFAGRACWKAEETSCVHCGNHLDYSIVCPKCSELYPDYYVNQPSRWMQSGTAWWERFEIRSRRRDSAPVYKPTKVTTVSTPSPSVEKFSKSTMVKAGIALVILAMVVTGTVAYQTIQKQRRYSEDFFLALYGIKTGSALCLQSCSRISTAWKNNLDSGQNVKPSTTLEEQMNLQKLKSRVDSVMQRLDKPPSKFVTSKEKLSKLYDVFTKLHTVSISPPGSLPTFTTSVNRLESDFNLAARDFKATLPAKLTEDFNNAMAKHKGLREL